MTSATANKPWDISPEKADKYVGHIIKRCRDNGVRAALRCGLRKTPDQAFTMHRYVAGWTEPFGQDEWAHYTIAALIADRPPATRNVATAEAEVGDFEEATESPSPGSDQPVRVYRPNLGATLARLSGDSDRVDSAERRLHLLVRQGVPGLQRHLPGVIRLLASSRIAPDWGVLLRDLLRWRVDRDRVARSWLQAYYRERFRETSAAGNSEAANELSGE